jgi:hypothetical protein
LYRSLETDSFGEKITYSNDVRTVTVKNVVTINFNRSGKTIKNVNGFTITETTTKAGTKIHWKSLPMHEGKLVIPLGLNSFIETVENFSRPQKVWDKYWDFILSTKDTKDWYEFQKGGKLIPTGVHR